MQLPSEIAPSLLLLTRGGCVPIGLLLPSRRSDPVTSVRLTEMHTPRKMQKSDERGKETIWGR